MLKEVKWLIILLFFISVAFHITITKTINPNLGILMGIPLISYLLIHLIRSRKPNIHDLAIQLPKKNTLLLSIISPIALGLIIHTAFLYANKGIFLFKNVSEILPLLLIGLSIATISAFLEEIIWRGYLQTQLRNLYSFHKTACIIAFVWSIWHVPIALFYKHYTNVAIGTFSYLILLFIVSYLLSSLREQSHSVIPAAIFHGLMNVFYFGDGKHMTISLHTIEMTKLVILCMFFLITIRLIKKFALDHSI